MMITIKFNTEKSVEINEYIAMKMKQIMEKHHELSLINEEYITEWKTYLYRFVKFYVLKFNSLQGIDKNFEVPSQEFIHFFYENIISSAYWDFVKWCLDGVEEYIDNLYKQAKENEEKIQKDLENNNAYLEYKSMKVIKKLESE